MFQLCFNLSRIHESVINSHALSFDPGLSEFAAKMFKELKLSEKDGGNLNLPPQYIQMPL